ncbi:MAG TPA: hypothetical protein ENN21_00235 [Spirochaetes bacterium]|nr:hypothetical protein [Spirochaetota bacterium]
MIFEYTALNQKGEKVADIVDATSESAARHKLRGQGLFVTVINSADKNGDAATENSTTLGKLYGRVSDYFSVKTSARQVGIFSRQLSTLLKAGMPLLGSINDIMEQIENRYFRRVIADIKTRLEEGSSLSACLERHRRVFSEMYINMVRVGENLGSLDEVIERLADLEEKRSILKSRIQAALWYPAFLVSFSMLVFFIIMINVVPSLSRMFMELGRELPFMTRVVMAVSGFLADFWVALLVAAVAGSYYFRKYLKTPGGIDWFDRQKLKLPLFSALYKKLIVLRFTQNLGILLNNRVDILKSFEIVKKIIMNTIIEKKIEEAAVRVKEGMSVSLALSRAEFLPKLVLGMITAGEASDNLDRMLLNIGNVYETELDLNITSLTSMIEPVIIIIMGMIIGVIVIAVLLPIFEMNLIIQ